MIVSGTPGQPTAPACGTTGEPAVKPRRTITDEHEAAKARKACEEFEAIFIQKLLSTMRRASESGAGGDDDFGGDIFKSMMDEQLSVALARGGGIGLARLLGKSLGREEQGPAGRVPAGEGREPRALPVRLTYEAYKEMRTDSSLAAFEPEISAAASDSGVSRNLIRAVILQESGGDPGAVSAKGAKGLMQLMDGTAAEVGVSNPFDPAENIRGGARYLGRLLREFKGDLELALAAYNAGAGAVKRHGGVPPYAETRDYVQRVMARLKALDSARGG